MMPQQAEIPNRPEIIASEKAGEYKFGARVPLSDGLRLLAGYLGGLRKAIVNKELRWAAISALPAWESYVLGMRANLRQLEEENAMPSSAYDRLNAAQRGAVIASIRKAVAKPGELEKTPDDLLLPILHCLTGRTGDLIRHVSATAARQRAD